MRTVPRAAVRARSSAAAAAGASPVARQAQARITDSVGSRLAATSSADRRSSQAAAASG
jgi:hypothetical protein